jgi:hypothetical protein
MRSKELLDKLIKKHGTAYKVSRATNIEQSRLSVVRHKDNRNFSAKELLMIMEAGEITKTQMLKISFADRLKDNKLYQNVASFLLIVGSLQFISQFQEGITTLVYYVK